MPHISFRHTTVALHRRLSNIEALLINQQRRINELEERMSLSDTALADLDAATTEIAEVLEGLQGLDSATATKISAAAARLRVLASDPATPVPVEPALPA